MRVNPSGPIPNEWAIFGDSPGFEDQQQGAVFVGKGGQELWAGMTRHVGMSRGDFYCSNLIKEGLAKGKEPKPVDVARALPEFLDEIEAVNPRVIITAGGLATRALLGPVLLADVHGIPHAIELAGRTRICFPIFSPAAGLHNKSYLAAFAYDLGRISAFRKGELQPWAPGTTATTKWLSLVDRKHLDSL